MNLYSTTNGFSVSQVDDGVLLQDVSCSGTSQATGAILGSFLGVRRSEVVAHWIDASNFAVVLNSNVGLQEIDVWAVGGDVSVFPVSGQSVGTGATSVTVLAGTGKTFKLMNLTTWNYRG
jgi:hypothetical protein